MFYPTGGTSYSATDVWDSDPTISFRYLLAFNGIQQVKRASKGQMAWAKKKYILGTGSLGLKEARSTDNVW